LIGSEGVTSLTNYRRDLVLPDFVKMISIKAMSASISATSQPGHP